MGEESARERHGALLKVKNAEGSHRKGHKEEEEEGLITL